MELDVGQRCIVGRLKEDENKQFNGMEGVVEEKRLSPGKGERFCAGLCIFLRDAHPSAAMQVRSATQ
jgi:hypothetical protein